ncbi:hypothetical protein PGT21_030633 [Puccinia graminis f. sp. tritici]|uniref:Uncharacterized protein n=1 Tax=Puccinia graminis f. sp. tritici TaxID=56615 RepID=A0A5B0QXN2_PUCGR|nr:hypothetical protein PGT21_030633 [Puccinia graminis f. sp. tritici]
MVIMASPLRLARLCGGRPLSKVDLNPALFIRSEQRKPLVPLCGVKPPGIVMEFITPRRIYARLALPNGPKGGFLGTDLKCSIPSPGRWRVSSDGHIESSPPVRGAESRVLARPKVALQRRRKGPYLSAPRGCSRAWQFNSRRVFVQPAVLGHSPDKIQIHCTNTPDGQLAALCVSLSGPTTSTATRIIPLCPEVGQEGKVG